VEELLGLKKKRISSGLTEALAADDVIGIVNARFAHGHGKLYSCAQ
jgi:hypothetical protein